MNDLRTRLVAVLSVRCVHDACMRAHACAVLWTTDVHVLMNIMQ
jgi:hypothetical protein